MTLDPSPTRPDPLLLELLRNELYVATDEMAISISKTGRSPMLSAGDFATAVADRRGNVIGAHLPVMFTCLFTSVLAAVLEKWEGRLAPGDVIVCNDPFGGASHKPDVFVIVPVFLGEELAGFSLAYSHHTDVGGRFAGGISSLCATSFEEGIRLPGVKLYKGNALNHALVDILRSNIRAGDEFMADIEAKVAGCSRGAVAYQSVVGKYGLGAAEACFDRLMDVQERRARRAFEAVPDGDYAAEIILKEDGLGNTGLNLPIVVTLRFRGDRLIVDLTGTAAQVPSAINLTLANTWSMVCESIYLMLGSGSPFNVGFTRPIDLIAPPGTLVNPNFPGAVGGRAAVFILLAEAVYQAMGHVVPDRAPAGSNGMDAALFSGTRASGAEYSMMDIIPGSWGARPMSDGVDAALPFYYSAISAERLESEIPIIVEELTPVLDSGGPGRHRGGVSLAKQYRFLADATVMVRTNRHAGGSFALTGGRQGAPARNTLMRADGTSEELAQSSHLHLRARTGDRLRHETGGQGGSGPPSERDRALVLRDLKDGKVSQAGAIRDYGVSEADLGEPLAGSDGPL